MRTTKLGMVAALAAVAVVASITVVAATTTETIKARQQAMEDIGHAMKALGAMAKRQAPFEADAVRSHAQTIADRLHQAADLFPEGSDAGDVETRAKPEIWADPEGFQRDLEATTEAAVAMQSVTDEADFLPALGALGNGCKSCHDSFRRPKQ